MLFTLIQQTASVNGLPQPTDILTKMYNTHRVTINRCLKQDCMCDILGTRLTAAVSAKDKLRYINRERKSKGERETNFREPQLPQDNVTFDPRIFQSTGPEIKP